ncbi:MAG: SPOR domain-containing protein [Treponema sp.]|nr:SPOR domain-containing protein [Treponema sp.]
MNKKLFAIVIFSLFTSLIFAEPKAKDIKAQAVKQSTVEESVSYVKNQIKSLTVASEKRAAYVFLASLQEQLALYGDAQKSYATAAGIAAGDAEGMPQKTNEQLVIDAVRCALCCGDWPTADSYLNSAVRNSKDANIQSYVKLYAQWSALCKAENVDDLNEPLELLKAYLKVQSMKSVHPVILLTLWYVTGDKSWSEQITKNYPNSTEAAIVKGDVQLLPTPFWFFVPKSGVAEQGTGTFKEDISVAPATKTTAAATTTKDSKWQLGLFKTESNAKLLCEEVKQKGFDAYIISEKRASGTTYYIVLVKDDGTGTTADKLRSSGYDCYLYE